MRHEFPEIEQRVREVIKATPIATHFRDVFVDEGAFPDGDPFLRIHLILDDLPSIVPSLDDLRKAKSRKAKPRKPSGLSPLSQMIQDLQRDLLDFDDRFPSVCIVEKH